MDYNFYYFKFICDNPINYDHLIEIYCNNFNYNGIYTSQNDYIVFQSIVVPKYCKFIYIKITNCNSSYVYYVPNNQNTYRLILDDNAFYLTIKQIANKPFTVYMTPIVNKIEDDEHKYIYHNELKTIIPENTNSLWNEINNLLSNGNSNINKNIRIFLTKMIGNFLISSLSKYYINYFIKNYNIDKNEYSSNDFNSFNDFFVRQLLIQPQIYDDTVLFRSSCTARILHIDKNKLSAKINVKGTDFDIDTLIDENRYDIETAIICRLSVEDYHHIHMPYSGKLVNIKIIGDDYYSVQQDVINKKSVNVLTKNYRHIYKFDTQKLYNNDFTFWIIPIGALIAGTVTHNLTVGQYYKSGERIANFSLGGSTVVILSTKKININEDIEYFSQNNIETYVKVGDMIGNIKTNFNNSPFPKHYHIKKPIKLTSNTITIFTLRLFILFFAIYVIRKIVKNNNKIIKK